MIDHRDNAQQLLHRVAPDVDIFSDRTLGNRLKLLMHHRDAHAQRLKRVVDVNLFALVIDFTLVHLVNAKHAFHQGGFASTVLTHQRVNRAGSELELRVIERLNARELLNNSAHLKTILRHERVPLLLIKEGACAQSARTPFDFTFTRITW